MSTTNTTALLIAALGAVVTVAGPLLPGGERLTPKDPPRTGHVTALARADDGSVLVGTQEGELWRLADGRWASVSAGLAREPVMALGADLSGPPSQGPIGTAAGLVNPPAGLPPVTGRIADAIPTPNGLVLATGEGLLIPGAGTWKRQVPEINAYRLARQTSGGRDWIHAGTVGRGVYSAPVDDLSGWEPNGTDLPPDAKVFAFAVTAAGRLIAGTDRGLHWQATPKEPWQPLKSGLDSRRILSLYLAPPNSGGTQRLWVGMDQGLYRLDLAETAGGLEALAFAQPIQAPEDALPVGVSGIVPAEGGVLLSAGAVYRYGQSGLPGWHWISVAGIGLILVGGWLFPGRASRPSEERTP